jgi:hypothetical protein
MVETVGADPTTPILQGLAAPRRYPRLKVGARLIFPAGPPICHPVRIVLVAGLNTRGAFAASVRGDAMGQSLFLSGVCVATRMGKRNIFGVKVRCYRIFVINGKYVHIFDFLFAPKAGVETKIDGHLKHE